MGRNPNTVNGLVFQNAPRGAYAPPVSREKRRVAKAACATLALLVPRTKLIASQGTHLPLPGREDTSLWLRIQFLAHLARRKRSEEPLKGSRTKEEKNVTGTKNQPDKNKSPPARDTKRALHSSPARDTKRALHSSTQTSRSASMPKLHYGRLSPPVNIRCGTSRTPPLRLPNPKSPSQEPQGGRSR
ncbi:hypothetical protein NDU88_003715 [Pleurodeles waltl]|uniref:Uncharacterized protein n=1 Tax=Pleurodeles waltl TaxID=8319 RepID=A0AAV7VHW0_PLEWA|nr:hypothetical protein NDU88_003715 [Pleurodeles waltl]